MNARSKKQTLENALKADFSEEEWREVLAILNARPTHVGADPRDQHLRHAIETVLAKDRENA